MEYFLLSIILKFHLENQNIITWKHKMALSIQNTNSTIVVTNSTTTKSSTVFQEALEAFYDIHQRSQITGVSTQEYNQALTKIGIDTTDSFAAIKGINLLQSYGYNTNKPTDQAIVKYGNTDVAYGNKSYMKNGTELSSEALTTEIKHLNETSNNAYEGAKNYYDIALKNVQSSSTLSTDDALKAKLKTQILTLANNDETFLKEILKDL